MSGQTIGTVNVKIGQSSTPKAVSIAYGTKTLASLTDVSTLGIINNDVLVYKAETNSFIFQPVTDTQLNIDNGYF